MTKFQHSQKIKAWHYLEVIADELSRENDVKVGLLIGANCPQALEPLQIIPSQNNGPFAMKTSLGWCVIGPLRKNHGLSSLSCHHISVTNTDTETTATPAFVIEDQFKETSIENMLKKLYEVDQVQSIVTEQSEVSQDDVKFLKLMNTEVCMVDGHYQLPLPFRDKDISFPNNRWLAEKRAESLKRRFIRDPKFHEEYSNFIGGMISKGQARIVKSHYMPGSSWFIPHHGVYHPSKGKIRVVFDCSAECNGTSLNKQLLQGPDLTNQLIGVLIRFRQERVAFMGDIEAMFYQVMIPEEQRCFVQFLWWLDGDYNKRLTEYEMCVHIFGGTSSPSCCNFALRKAATDGERELGTEASQTLIRNFYVDDLLKSKADVASSIHLIKNVISMCSKSGFKLTKFISNNEEVMNHIPVDDQRKLVKTYDLLSGDVAMERALGVQWCISNDTFVFQVALKNHQYTRRGLLSAVSSIYDPLGLVAPFIPPAKRILQQLYHSKLGWDECMPTDVCSDWDKWSSTLPLIKDIKVSRCLKPPSLGTVTETSLYHFSDASDVGYGQCSYVRMVNEKGDVHCALLIGKSQVAPLKSLTTIPRLELMVATLSAQVAANLIKELEYQIDYQIFWTDSEVVLGYIKNNAKRFKLFVANIIAFINQLSSPNQWRYVFAKENPADYTSCGLQPNQHRKIETYYNGPTFLWHDIEKEKIVKADVQDDDPELKKTKQVFATNIHNGDLITDLECRISNWNKMKRVIAYVRMFITKLKSGKRNHHSMKLRNQTTEIPELTVDGVNTAQESIIKMLQQKHYKTDIKNLQSAGKQVKNFGYDGEKSFSIVCKNEANGHQNLETSWLETW